MPDITVLNTAFKIFRIKELISPKLKTILVVLFLTFSIPVFANVYYVSADGNDRNPGTSESAAWQTLAKVNRTIFHPGDIILFRRGDIFTGTLEASSSGNVNSPITYGAYGTGEKPKIYGSEEITGWTKYSGNIYMTFLNIPVNQVFVDSVKLKIARSPNNGYFTINSVQGSTGLISRDLDSKIKYKGAKWFGRTRQWTADLKNVVNSVEKSLILNSPPIYNLDINEGFILMNKLEFLDSPGEWYYEKETNKIYLWTLNSDSPKNHIIRGSVYQNGLIITDKQYVTIKDLVFLQQSENGIYLKNNKNIVIENNEILYPDGVGIFDSSESKNYIIKNNTIVGANHYGMDLRISYSLISDNKILKTALFDNIGLSGTGNPNFGAGVRLVGSEGNNIFKYNRIIESGYHGIYFAKPNNLIEFNFIKDACLFKGDGGGIYGAWSNPALPGTKGTIVRNNIVLNVHGPKEGYSANRDFGEGIYIDESSEDVLVENNTVANCSNSGIFLHNNSGVEVKNNTIINGRYGILIKKEHGKNSINNNILYMLDKDEYEPNQILVNRNTYNSYFNNNIYINHYNSSKIFKNNDNYFDFNDWKKTTEQDSKSTIDVSPLKSGEKEKLIYNDTKETKIVKLNNTIFKDIYGNRLSGSLILQPFTSMIIIGTNFENIQEEFQNSLNLNQTYEITTSKSVNELVAVIDISQLPFNTFYQFESIHQSSDQYFNVNPTTGEIFTIKNIDIKKDTVFNVEVKISDKMTQSLLAYATITIKIKGIENKPITDFVSPTITSFTIPNTSNSLIIPITSLTATDNIAVVGYLLTEKYNTPSINDENWNSSPPTSFTFSATGIRPLYAWTKDAAGNVSKSSYESVKISLPDSVSNTLNTTEFVSICQGQEYLGWNTTGEYKRTLTAASGVDSIVTTKLEVNPVYRITEDITIPPDSSYNGWTNPDEYTRTLTSVTGCDSIVTTHLFFSPYYYEEEIYICGGGSYEGWTETGEYKRSFKTESGKDSIVTTHLWINPMDTVFEDKTILENENYLGWNETGQYQRVLTSVEGCDSIVVVNLTVEKIPEKNPNEPLADPNNPYFEWSASKKYQREYNPVISYDFKMYPNPAKNFIYVDYTYKPNLETKIELLNDRGKTLFIKPANSALNKIPIYQYPSGMYFVRSLNSQNEYVKKLIIE